MIHPAAKAPALSSRPERALAAVLLLLGVGRTCHAQTVDPPTPTPAHSGQTYRIAGRAVDAADGRPLRHASLTLFSSATGAGRLAEVETDDTGGFSIAAVPAGKFRLQGAARGYITAAYDAHGQYSSAIVAGAGLDTESLVLRLQPAAMMGGRVTDEAGDPVRNATVTLFRENTDSGVLRITQFRNARTDDLGAYEITRLPPGAYYASVRAVPWYATYPPDDSVRPPGLGFAVNVDPALNVVYPLTFYPEATESSRALAIPLKPGDRFHADFHLTPQPAMHLILHLPGAAPSGSAGGNANPSNGRSIPQLQQKVFDEYEGILQQRVQMFGSTMEIAGLPSGNYVLRNPGTGSYDGPSRSVDLTGGSLSLDVAASPSFGSVTLTLSASPDKPPDKPSQTLQIVLRRSDSTTGTPSGRMKDGQVEFPNLEPGDYRIEPANSRLHVESITEEGKTKSGALLHVTGQGQAVTLTLGAGSVPVTGYVRREGKGVAGAMVVLVPAAGDHSIDLYRRDQSDLDGSFRFLNVLPGNYLLVAIGDGWSLEWGKPEALAPFLLKAVPVAVPPVSHSPMKIEEGVPVQPR